MGLFGAKPVCGVCGKTLGMNRYKIRKDDAWCCPDCLKKAQNGENPLWIFEYFNDRLAKICIKKTISNYICQLALKIWVVPRILFVPYSLEYGIFYLFPIFPIIKEKD